ncbi:hypothetical protein HGA04_10320 [Gordonia rubripertincta]|uniref:DUF222 domain-containing protein n=1 Tax=Gordonia rubripertincta TaxID=36822 RepID=A0AAW6RA61_GORRU|nr:hypothetical protein [Gordonia rubripertincta]MDG6780591.1 hypothetical protein [Gordonia rubripertincta]NKY63053.1 hypothetical protein [Gordonia rubripertincta]
MTAGLSPPAHAELDGMLAELAQGAIEWAAMPLQQRSDLFLRTRTTVGQVSRRWAEISIRIKSTPPSVRGEEWLAGPYRCSVSARRRPLREHPTRGSARRLRHRLPP